MDQKVTSKQYIEICPTCDDYFYYTDEDIKWVEYGTYSSKIITCPFCGCINIIKYVDANGLYVNDDERYYE